MIMVSVSVCGELAAGLLAGGGRSALRYPCIPMYLSVGGGMYNTVLSRKYLRYIETLHS